MDIAFTSPRSRPVLAGAVGVTTLAVTTDNLGIPGSTARHLLPSTRPGYLVTIPYTIYCDLQLMGYYSCDYHKKSTGSASDIKKSRWLIIVTSVQYQQVTSSASGTSERHTG